MYQVMHEEVKDQQRVRKVQLPEAMDGLEQDRVTQIEMFADFEIFRTQSGKAFSRNGLLSDAI